MWCSTRRPRAAAAATPNATDDGLSAGEAVLVRRSTEVTRDPEVRERLAREVGGPSRVDAALFEDILAEPGTARTDAPATARDALISPSGARGGETPTVIRRSSTSLEDR